MKRLLSGHWFKRDKKSKTNQSLLDSDPSEKTILVVDDSRTQIFATKKILKTFGYRVITAENGKVGIIKARDEKPDLILMDIVMPIVNGFQATRYLKKHAETADIPIIIVSSSTQEADKAWGLKLGACDFVNKPIEENQLQGKISRHIKKPQQIAPVF